MRDLLKVVGVALVSLTLSQQALAQGGPPPKPACGTNGALQLTALSTAGHSYVQTTPGSIGSGFTVSSPPMNITGACNSALPYVFGNGNGSPANELTYSIEIGDITDSITAALVSPAVDAAIVAAFGSPAFLTAPFKLTNPGTGSQAITFTFTNSAAIPVGLYDIEIVVKPQTGVGVGEPTPRVFALEVTAPTVVDTLPPSVAIQSPNSGDLVCLNGDISVAFTATDPLEGGAGTGIVDVGAEIESTGLVFHDDISSDLVVSPSLPVAAGVQVTATATEPTYDIGGFTLTAFAEDAAGNVGEATTNYTVSANVAPLPPISVPNRQFKAGSTVPVKWTITDCDGLFLPPFDSIKVTISDNVSVLIDRYAGDGAENVRWELDDYGNATQYITNFQIPANGLYTVDVYVDDVDSNSAKQGSFGFIAAGKGGKT